MYLAIHNSIYIKLMQAQNLSNLFVIILNINLKRNTRAA